MKLNPGEMLDHETGEIKTAEQIVAEIAAASGTPVMPASLHFDLPAQTVAKAMHEGGYMLTEAQSAASIDSLLDRRKAVLEQLIELDDEETVTDWFTGNLTPAHDGEYEILHPVTGLIERAEYDPLFEEWSCVWQYPTWRGVASC